MNRCYEGVVKSMQSLSHALKQLAITVNNEHTMSVSALKSIHPEAAVSVVSEKNPNL